MEVEKGKDGEKGEKSNENKKKEKSDELNIYWRVNGCVDQIEYIMDQGEKVEPSIKEKWSCYFEGDTKNDYKIFKSVINIKEKSTVLKLGAKIDNILTKSPTNA